MCSYVSFEIVPSEEGVQEFASTSQSSRDNFPHHNPEFKRAQKDPKPTGQIEVLSLIIMVTA